MRIRAWVPVTAAMLAVPVQAMGAPPVQQGNWTAWYGCWVAVESQGGVTPVVCVLPGADATTARIATIEGGQIAEETTVRADGVARPIEEGGCSGEESAFFSADGRRVFTRAELACNGLGRLSTGVLALVSPDEWVDAQALTVNGQHAVRAIKYRTALPTEIPSWVASDLPRDQRLAQEAARIDAATPLGIAEVAEATRHVAAPAVEALLAERRHGFGLNAQKLMELRDAGVPTSTIDVMVALSYPAKFAVSPASERRPDRGTGDYNAARSWINSCYDDPFYRSSRYGCYNDRYGYGYSRNGIWGYSPYGYDPYGWNTGGRPVVVIVQRSDGDSEPSGGSVVKGRGYTRSGSTIGTAEPRGATERSSPSSATTKASPSSSGGSSSGGSSSSEPTRTAKPRGGNNN